MSPLTTILAIFHLSFACNAANNLTTLQAVQSFAVQLNKNWKIDSSNPPYQDADSIAEPTCIDHITACSTAYFSNYLLLQNAAAKVNITYVGHDDELQINAGKKDVTFTFTMASASLTSTTEGWNIGSQVRLTVGTPSQDTPVEANGVVSFSGGYKSESTHTETNTRTVSEVITCPLAMNAPFARIRSL